jgi:hypothetical protein
MARAWRVPEVHPNCNRQEPGVPYWVRLPIDQSFEARRQEARPPETRFPGAFEDAPAAVRDVFVRIAEFGDAPRRSAGDILSTPRELQVRNRAPDSPPARSLVAEVQTGVRTPR